MPSYPGTVKVFESKADLTDTVFAAHVNQLQDEVFAIQTALGINPQGVAQTVGLRLGALESSVDAIANAEEPGTIEGSKTFAGVVTFADMVSFLGGAPITAVSTTTPPVRVGPLGGANSILDGNTIQARSALAPATLRLNPYGGAVYVGGNRVLTVADTGTGQSLNADKLQGYGPPDFASAGHKHAQNFAQVYNGTGMTIVNGVDETGWHDVTWDQTTVHVYESGGEIMIPALGRFYTPPSVGPALYYFGVRLAFNKDSSVGTRRIRFIDSNGAIIDMMAELANLMALDYISLSGMYYFTGESNYYLKAQVYQDSGSSRSIYAHSSVRPFQATWAAVSRRLN